MNILCWKNLKDYQLTYQLKLIKGLKITIDHHWFYLQLQLGICRFLPGTALVKSRFYEKADYIIFQTFIKF